MLTAWAASPARLREDANAEEDQGRVGYRDRLVVELAQNAVDAAADGAAPARLLLRDTGKLLLAANTGAPLTGAGVEALSTLRASAKRDDGVAVGRFGVGFAAVLAVTDRPALLSTSGGVAWSAERSRAAVAAISALLPELDRRGGHTPVLRLPFPERPEPAEAELLAAGYASVVRLPLTGAGRAALDAMLDGLDPSLPLVLPGLVELRVERPGRPVRELRTRYGEGRVEVDDAGVVTRWRVVDRAGELEPADVADLPVEQRARRWAVRAAVPTDADGRPEPLPTGVAAVLRAPQPTDEPLSLPVLLSASLPLAVSRRTVVPGSVTDLVLGHAADALAELVVGLCGPWALGLVPTGLAAGAVDGALRAGLLGRLQRRRWVPSAEAGAGAEPGPGAETANGTATEPDADPDANPAASVLRPADAVALDLADADRATPLLAGVLPGLLPPAWSARRWQPALAALQVRRAGVGEVVEALGGLDRPAAWWGETIAALGAETDIEALGALPVPLDDGRTSIGPRGLLLPAAGLDAAGLSRAGLHLRVVHPAAVAALAARRLLERLGAREVGPSALLGDPAVLDAVARSLDDEPPADPDLLAEAVLGLVGGAGLGPEGLPAGYGELALRDVDGELAPAAELALPAGAGGVLSGLLDPDDGPAEVDPALVDRFGAEPLTAVGVLRTFALLHRDELVVDPDALDDDPLDVDDAAGWLDAVDARLPEDAWRSGPPVVRDLVAVRDLELVADDRWPLALAELARPGVVEALAPLSVLLADGRVVQVASPSGWWLSRRPVLAGSAPAGMAAPGAEDLVAALYDPAPELPAGMAALLGCRLHLADVLADPDELVLADLLERLASRPLTLDQVRALHGAIAVADPWRQVTGDPGPVRRVRALVVSERSPGARGGTELVAVPPRDAVALDRPDLLVLAAGRPLLPVPAGLAAGLAGRLGVPLLDAPDPPSGGAATPAPAVLATLLGGELPGHRRHDRPPLPWQVEAGVLHLAAAADNGAVAAGYAWLLGRWPDRHRLRLALSDPAGVASLARESAVEPLPTWGVGR